MCILFSLPPLHEEVSTVLEHKTQDCCGIPSCPLACMLALVACVDPILGLGSIDSFLAIRRFDSIVTSRRYLCLSAHDQEAILDVNPDEAVDMAKKQRLLHWDSRKKKFVKTTLAELSERKSGGSRKIRTESGKGAYIINQGRRAGREPALDVAGSRACTAASALFSLGVLGVVASARSSRTLLLYQQELQQYSVF